MMRNLFLETDRLSLHPIGEESKEQMLDILYCDEIKKTYMIPDFPSEAEAEKMFEKFVRLTHDDNRFVYGVFLKDRLIGFFNDVCTEGKTIEMGYVIHPKFKNKGYATEAFRRIIEELFRVGFKTVMAGYFVENCASRRVMEKSGLQEIDKTDDIEYRGKVHHCKYLAINREEHDR